MLYLIDEVLDLPEGTIDDILLNPDYNVNNFMDFIKSAGLTQVFNRTVGNRYTMFVPTNQALASMDQGFLTQIKNNRINSRRKLNLKVNLWCLYQKAKKKTQPNWHFWTSKVSLQLKHSILYMYITVNLLLKLDMLINSSGFDALENIGVFCQNKIRTISYFWTVIIYYVCVNMVCILKFALKTKHFQ